jgi:hypothetical protein
MIFLKNGVNRQVPKIIIINRKTTSPALPLLTYLAFILHLLLEVISCLFIVLKNTMIWKTDLFP